MTSCSFHDKVYILNMAYKTVDCLDFAYWSINYNSGSRKTDTNVEKLYYLFSKFYKKTISTVIFNVKKINNSDWW